jgi:CO/xanthine dehydrogenase FAD-binding subunit
MMNLRLARPEMLIDIGRLPLDSIQVGRESVMFGALAGTDP